VTDDDECAFDDGTHCFAGYCRCGKFSPGTRDMTDEEREEFDRIVHAQYRRSVRTRLPGGRGSSF
jgi:hypothetical protein